jgi:protoporphyrinogen oxidase
VEHDGYRFDLGGHRFLTDNKITEQFVRDLLRDELLSVPRKSSICLFGRFFDYPLKPANAFFGLGPKMTTRILADYAVQRLRPTRRSRPEVSLEDWVINRFGKVMFDLYFRQYSEKVWGVPCREISAEWVAKRIEGLSLGKAVKNAFFRACHRELKTLSERFLYPRTGIGAIAERLQELIGRPDSLATETAVVRLRHDGRRILEGEAIRRGNRFVVRGENWISSIPLTAFVGMLRPLPPAAVLDAAARLRFRDLVVVAIMLDRERATDLSWLYLPEQHIPFGRIHEPKNWSPAMAPEGRTHLVAEYFCFQGDRIWNMAGRELEFMTVRHLVDMGFIRQREVVGSCVVRVPHAYPVLDVGYRGHYDTILGYLDRFENLRISGRSGAFQYLNMDHAIESGIAAAESIASRTGPADAAKQRERRHSGERIAAAICT